MLPHLTPRAAPAALSLLEKADAFWREFGPDNRWPGQAALWLGRCYLALGRRFLPTSAL
jgi:hypothetical protein